MIITQSEGGGLRRHLTDLVDALDEKGYQILFVLNYNFADKTFIAWSRLPHENTQFINLTTFDRKINFLSDFKTLIKVIQLIRRFHPDVVHTHSSKAGVIGRIAAKLTGVKLIFYTPHAYSFLSSEFSENKKKLFIIIEKMLSKYATTMTFNVSDSERNIALKYNIDIPSKLVTIFNGIPDLKKNYRLESRKKLHFLENETVIGTVARLSAQKNPLFFIDIARSMETKYPDYKIFFCWMGGGDLKSVYEGQLPKNIRFLGEKEESDKLIFAYDAYISTSIFEGFSYSLLEAARAHLPVLLSSVPGNIDFSRLYSQGSYLFSLNQSADSVADLIVDLHRRHILNGKHSEYSVTFSYDDMVKKIESFYNKS